MKKWLMISLLGLLSTTGCVLEEAVEWGLECPPRYYIDINKNLVKLNYEKNADGALQVVTDGNNIIKESIEIQI